MRPIQRLKFLKSLFLPTLLLAWAIPQWSQAQTTYGTPYTFRTIAGTAGIAGSTDGLGITQFVFPTGMAMDGSGNIYVSGNDTIRKITPAGVITILAGSPGIIGSADGTGPTAQFFGPHGLAVDGNGNVYVADTGSHTIRKVTPAGVVTTLAGSPGNPGHTDGTGSAARFGFPQGVAVDRSGNVYVADTLNDIIRMITPAGAVTTLAGTAGDSGSADGTGPAAQFALPTDVAVDGSDNVYVADSGNNTIRMITSAGVVTTLAGLAGINSGSADGTGSAARFSNPTGVTLDGSGNLYVTDNSNNTIRMVTSAGVVTTLAGTAGVTGYADGTGPAAKFNDPIGVTVDGSANVYVADTNNHSIRKITAGGVVTTFPPFAQLAFPLGVAVDGNGTVFVADSNNDTIRAITAAGVVTTLAGSPGNFGFADGTGPTAQFHAPSGVVVDGSDNVYVSDSNNGTIRKITPAGVVTTFAGRAENEGSADGTGAAAQFSDPTGMALDRSGNLYVADTSNNTIRKITPAGVVTTLAGTAGVSGSADGTGPAAQFDSPRGVAVDGNGNVYVADTFNSIIRKITPAGVVTTLAGMANVGGTTDGTGSAARFLFPYGVAADGSGNIFVADTNNNIIREITPVGVVTTLGGTPDAPGSLDGPGSLIPPGSAYDPEAQFGYAYGLAVDGNDNVYVADSTNDTIREGLPNISLSAFNTMAFKVGQSVALDTQDDVGDNLYYYVVTGPALVSGIVDNIVTFTGTAPVEVEIINAAQLPPAPPPSQPADPPSISIQAAQPSSTEMGNTGDGTGSPGTQTMSAFSFIPAQVYGANAFNIRPPIADSSSGEPVVVTVQSGPAMISANDTVTITGAGTVVLAADEAGNADYSAAPEVTTSFTVAPAPLTVFVNGGGASVFGATPTDPGINYTGNLYGRDTLLSLGLSDDFNLTSASAAGAYTINVTGAGNVTNYSVTTQSATYTISPIAYANWATQNFTPAEQNDADDPTFTASNSTPFGDSVPNLLKYVFDIDPSVPMNATAREALPTVGIDTTTTPGTVYLTLTYIRYGGLSPEMLPAVQTSADLNNWTTISPDITVPTMMPNGDIKTEVEVKINGSNPLFLRVLEAAP